MHTNRSKNLHVYIYMYHISFFFLKYPSSDHHCHGSVEHDRIVRGNNCLATSDFPLIHDWRKSKAQET